MKKLTSILLAGATVLSLVGCSSNNENVLRVGATTAPHAEILEEAKEILAKDGIELEITEFSDYPQINPSTSDGSLDANFFQHQPYLDSYNEDQGYKSGDDGFLVSAGAIHYEPLGLYSKKFKSVDEVADGATITIPNDATNEARALFLLQDNGLIELDDKADLDNATVADIKTNSKNLDIVELAADQTGSKLDDTDFAVVNGNYALTAKIDDYLITTESEDSQAAQTYQNIIAVKEGHENDEKIQKLVKALKSKKIKKFIEKKYGVSVVPAA